VFGHFSSLTRALVAMTISLDSGVVLGERDIQFSQVI